MNARSDFPGNAGSFPARWPGAPRPVLTVADNGRPRPELPCAEPPRAIVPRSELPVHDARQLTGPTGQAQIVLDGQVYALRITRAGKLILTK
jgi:hemin uptake protein HemP